MIESLVVAIVIFLLACALVRVAPVTIIPAGWKPVLYVVALIVLVLVLAARQGWI